MRQNKLLAVVLCHCCYFRSRDIFRIVRKHWYLGHTGHCYYMRCTRRMLMYLRLIRWVLEERCRPVGRPFCSYWSRQSRSSKSVAMSEVLSCWVADSHVGVVVLLHVGQMSDLNVHSTYSCCSRFAGHGSQLKRWANPSNWITKNEKNAEIQDTCGPQHFLAVS